MVAQVLSFPMRLQSNGRLALVEQDSEGHIAEELATICLSRPGERGLVPDFGIEDPSFEGGISPEEIASQAAIFGVPAVVTEVHSLPTDDTNVAVLITFEGAPIEDDGLPGGVDDES